MPDTERGLSIYRELADVYDQRGEAQLRDRFLVLATDAAFEMGHAAEADQLRRRLLQCNPHHMLKPFASFPEALRSTDVQSYLKNLKHDFPLDTAAAILMQLRTGKTVDGGRSKTKNDSQLDMLLPLDDEPDRINEPVFLFSEDSKDQAIPMAPPRKDKDSPRSLQAPPTAKGQSSLLGRPASSSPIPVMPLRPLPLRKEARSVPRRTTTMPSDTEVRSGSWVAYLLVALVALVGFGLLVCAFLPTRLPI